MSIPGFPTPQPEIPIEPDPISFAQYQQALQQAKGGRLGLSFGQRLFLGHLAAFSCGFMLGSQDAGRMAALRFRAENAHRLPNSTPGWFMYHKAKHYYTAFNGIKQGVRKGIWLVSWVTVFFFVEESLDVFRGTWAAGRTLREMEGVDELEMKDLTKSVENNRNFVSSTLAGMATAGLWSVWNHFPLQTAARTIRMGLFVGLGYGLGQDALKWTKVNYIEKKVLEERWKDRGIENGKISHGTTNEIVDAQKVDGL